MKQELETALAAAAMELFDETLTVELSRPQEQFGDYATNVALQLANKLSKNPHEIAEQLATYVKGRTFHITAAGVAGPGFINLTLSDEALLSMAKTGASKPLAGQTIVAEYSDPNPFKVLHAGHLYTSVVGDATANLLEMAGAAVHRVNFGGDVGLHVAKAMWAILDELDGENPKKLGKIPEHERSDWMAAAYVRGTQAYEIDEPAKAEITSLNKRLYDLHDQQDHDSSFAQIYWTCRQWSYDYFDQFYARIGCRFDKYYPESQTAPLGLKTVQEQLNKGVYQKSDGAVVFNGEKYGLHTRVFINSNGLPTYEAKDVGLIMAKWSDYHFDRSVIITGNDIAEYMKVVLKSIEQFAPELARVTTHLTHGNVKLAGGVKMSSRKGKVLRAVDVLDAAQEANKAQTGHDNEQTVLGAVKYAFLKTRIGGDIIYDPVDSVSMEGNSGPYLQYAHARARSILRKAPSPFPIPHSPFPKLQPGERSLLRKVTEYPEVVDKAVAEMRPHHVCGYLYELAQSFNSFYEHNRVIGDPREAVRLGLVTAYAAKLKDGLQLLGISAPEQM